MRTLALTEAIVVAVLVTGYVMLAAARLQPPPLPEGQPEDSPQPEPAPGEGLLTAPPVPGESGDRPPWPSAGQPVTPVRAAAAAPWDGGTEPDTAWRKEQGLALAAWCDKPVTAPAADLWERHADPQNARLWEYQTGEWPEVMAALQAHGDERPQP